MKEIVERILKAERLAQEQIEKARKEADGLLAQARKEAQESINRNAQDTSELLQRKRDESQQEFTRQKEDVLKKTRDEVSASVSVREKNIRAISEKLFARIISVEE